jgi:hypothetical protein
MIKIDLDNGIIHAYPGRIPSSPIVWPAPRQIANQIQQTKGSAKPQAAFVLPTTQPSKARVAPRTTPAPVSAVRVILRPNAGGKQVTVQFTHPSGDPYFASANVYLRRAGQQPTLVASGAQSPLTFVAPLNAAPHSVYVTSCGNWGETNVLTSPSHPVRLT